MKKTNEELELLAVKYSDRAGLSEQEKELVKATYINAFKECEMKYKLLFGENIQIKDEVHDTLTLKLRDLVGGMAEFSTSPFIEFKEENKKGFNVFTDNGFGNGMKRFTVIIEDHKK